MIPRVLVFAGSNRSGSFNRQLAQAAAKVLALQGAEVTMIALADYPLPLVDEDLKKEKGVPANAIRLARLFAAHDALFLASPEYNASIPPLVKNTIDWVSLVRSDGSGPVRPFDGLTVALGSASDGKLGGIRGLYHLRAVLMNVGAQVVSQQCAISWANKAFGEDGMPSDEREAKHLEKACRALLDHCTPGRGR
ncbi:NADPH-dependent FMN reductase [Oricola thermophila]|uniref:NAD(P)H-dependent oxidoreductase n=1 Tax=Oricola thermophila TaxID=2742145 RepID=A0A6N1VJC6_9HYPH|nr:NAD(P)H-dependent oxidoreductase [Oricola thermophila]QKV19502.1 NAD(P)H-dependent oxidoreductase [Oricola thermophila]